MVLMYINVSYGGIPIGHYKILVFKGLVHCAKGPSDQINIESGIAGIGLRSAKSYNLKKTRMHKNSQLELCKEQSNCS